MSSASESQNCKLKIFPENQSITKSTIIKRYNPKFKTLKVISHLAKPHDKDVLRFGFLLKRNFDSILEVCEYLEISAVVISVLNVIKLKYSTKLFGIKSYCLEYSFLHRMQCAMAKEMLWSDKILSRFKISQAPKRKSKLKINSKKVRFHSVKDYIHWMKTNI